MKNLHNILGILLIVFITLSSCKKNDDSSPSNSTTVNTTVQQGKWKITLYKEDSNDETGDFSGYEFQFNSDGTVNAVKAGSTTTGSWSDNNDNSQVKLVINFGATVPLDGLNEDWHVLQQNSAKIELEHISGGNGGIDHLTFEKI